MIYIYGMPLYKVLLAMFFSAALWLILLRVLPKKALYLSSGLILLLSLWGIAHYCVVFRAASAQHIFIFSTTYADLGEEYFREMVMNMLLYFPLGISLSFFVGPWSILVAFALSLGIESWQYFAGTGLAQGTDVIMNTIGAAIGALPWIIVRCITALKSRGYGPCK